MSYQPIENYGIVGDMNTVALVGLTGSIDLLCFPHFDSPSIFAALLDDARGGRFEIAAAFLDAERRQIYLPNTNILFTRSLSESGAGEVIDYMTLHEGWESPCLVRRARAVRGSVPFRVRFAPRFDYGRASHTVESTPDGWVLSSEGADRLSIRLRSNLGLRPEHGDLVGEITLQAGEEIWFVLEQAIPGKVPALEPTFVHRTYEETAEFWRRWVSRCTYTGRYQEPVIRSALCLKLLTSQVHGSIIAAPTFGLPETIGGERNWDYRYTWIRDASFTLYALIRLGYTEEAARFMDWIEARCSEIDGGTLQIMYGFDGRHDLPEETLGHFEGYRGSRPVRIGNGAYAQLQLDIYGELLDSVYLFDKHGAPIHYDLWRSLVKLVDWVCENWQQADEGIWEVRGGKQEFLYSRLMCWVAIDRALRLSAKRSLPAPTERWRAQRDAIYRDVFESFWDPVRRTFVQHKGSVALDAATLLMPLVRFIGPTDPRWLSTLRAIESTLLEDSLVYRYRGPDSADDGLAGPEGTFSMCGFWYVECLARAGRIEDARFGFEKMLAYGNHLGLYAEELGLRGEMLGNFPQAFTHLGMISAAVCLDRSLSGGRFA